MLEEGLQHRNDLHGWKSFFLSLFKMIAACFIVLHCFPFSDGFLLEFFFVPCLYRYYEPNENAFKLF